ncbi:hypothetical protein L1049_023870 [Liquidambar formosana]|uniref:Uncharacterized protein n=1 Tax=Liquidambar formosana TaxID=63359 RepID=A0AAP0WXZ6_LIQFO
MKADLGPWSPKKVGTPTCPVLLRPNTIYKWVEPSLIKSIEMSNVRINFNSKLFNACLAISHANEIPWRRTQSPAVVLVHLAPDYTQNPFSSCLHHLELIRPPTTSGPRLPHELPSVFTNVSCLLSPHAVLRSVRFAGLRTLPSSFAKALSSPPTSLCQPLFRWEQAMAEETHLPEAGKGLKKRRVRHKKGSKAKKKLKVYQGSREKVKIDKKNENYIAKGQESTIQMMMMMMKILPP